MYYKYLSSWNWNIITLLNKIVYFSHETIFLQFRNGQNPRFRFNFDVIGLETLESNCDKSLLFDWIFESLNYPFQVFALNEQLHSICKIQSRWTFWYQWFLKFQNFTSIENIYSIFPKLWLNWISKSCNYSFIIFN